MVKFVNRAGAFPGLPRCINKTLKAVAFMDTSLALLRQRLFTSRTEQRLLGGNIGSTYIHHDHDVTDNDNIGYKNCKKLLDRTERQNRMQKLADNDYQHTQLVESKGEHL
jgi:hypothetical protein